MRSRYTILSERGARAEWSWTTKDASACGNEGSYDIDEGTRNRWFAVVYGQIRINITHRTCRHITSSVEQVESREPHKKALEKGIYDYLGWKGGGGGVFYIFHTRCCYALSRRGGLTTHDT